MVLGFYFVILTTLKWLSWMSFVCQLNLLDSYLVRVFVCPMIELLLQHRCPLWLNSYYDMGFLNDETHTTWIRCECGRGFVVGGAWRRGVEYWRRINSRRAGANWKQCTSSHPLCCIEFRGFMLLMPFSFPTCQLEYSLFLVRISWEVTRFINLTVI